ncbi:TRAP transporter substrate-binding protein [Alcaligenes aquatilis]|uniref:TRAP transporter substrate-binding protein n=1 Tax=Alcaligenes aquatilis TaxID=323284 RepID=UPI003F8EFE42
MTLKKWLTGSVWVASLLLATTASAATFKVAIGDAAGGTQYELGKVFAEQLKEKSGGSVTVDLFPNSQLGDEQDTINDAAMGLLDFSILAINNITPFSPSVAVLTLPYVIQSLEDAKTLTQGEVGKELTEKTIRDAGVRIVGWSYSGFRVLTNSKRPVRTLDDLKGLIIRVPKNELMIAFYNALGVNPTPMAWNETFTALQQGVVDGQDNPYITISAMKFDEVQKYITPIRYLFSLEPLVMSEQVFQAQTPEVQVWILEAGQAATDYSYEYIQVTEDSVKQELQAAGMEIVELANNEQDWIDAATTKVWPAFYDSIGGKERLDAVLATLNR